MLHSISVHGAVLHILPIQPWERYSSFSTCLHRYIIDIWLMLADRRLFFGFALTDLICCEILDPEPRIGHPDRDSGADGFRS